MNRGTSWKGARVAVLGLGRSGLGAVNLLGEKQAVVVAVDDRPAREFEEMRESIGPSVAEWALGGVEPALDGLAALVVSPGVGRDHPVIAAALRVGIPVIGELELAASFVTGPIIAVTGTNGKSTTVSLVEAMLRASDRGVRLLGNIGQAVSAEVLELGADDVVVIEVSSFQLEWIDEFHPQAAAVLNVAPDHLNRYESLDDYAAAKRRILSNLDRGDSFVYPYHDARLGEWARSSVAEAWAFAEELPEAVRGVTVRGGQLVRQSQAGTQSLMALDDVPLLGSHNVSNVMAAFALVSHFGLPDENCAQAVREFRPLQHRAVDVPSTDGVRWIDDSKATNVHAALATARGIRSLHTWLLGGSGKGEDYSPLREAAQRAQRVICFGAEGPAIAAALDGCSAVVPSATLADAMEVAVEGIERGQVVLLSPACASFDEFTSFEERGDFFADWVRQHRGGAS